MPIYDQNVWTRAGRTHGMIWMDVSLCLCLCVCKQLSCTMCQCDGTLWRCVSVWRWEVILLSVTWITSFPSCLSTDGNSRISTIRVTADRARQDNLIQQNNNSDIETRNTCEQNYIDSRFSREGKQINLTTDCENIRWRSLRRQNPNITLAFSLLDSLGFFEIVETWLLSRSNSEYLWTCYTCCFVHSVIGKLIFF